MFDITKLTAEDAAYMLKKMWPDPQLVKDFAKLWDMYFGECSIVESEYISEIAYLIERYDYMQIVNAMYDYGMEEEIDKLVASVKRENVLVCGMECDSKAETERWNRCAKMWRECGWFKTK